MFNSDIVFVNVYFDNITFFSDAMSLVHFDLNNVSIDDDNFGDDNPKTSIHIRLMARFKWYNEHRTRTKEIRKELMHVAVACNKVRLLDVRRWKKSWIIFV